MLFVGSPLTACPKLELEIKEGICNNKIGPLFEFGFSFGNKKQIDHVILLLVSNKNKNYLNVHESTRTPIYKFR